MNIEGIHQETEDHHLLSEEQKWGIIISKKYFNLSEKEILETFDIGSRSSIYYVWNKYNTTGDIKNNYENAGRRTKITEEKKQEIKEFFKENPFSSVRYGANRLSSNEFTVSPSTLDRTLHEIGFKSGNSLPKKTLSKINQEKRMEYCLQNRGSTFKHAIFSDESLFMLDATKKLMWYCSIEDRIVEENPVPSWGRIHVWGAISKKRKSNLYIFRETVNAEVYQECLQRALLPMFPLNRYHRIFVQNNASSHTAKSTQAYLRSNNITLMEHPPLSPDLNPIELVWAEMKKNFSSMKYLIKTQGDFELMLKELWENVPQTNIVHYIDHLEQQMKEIIKVNGKHIIN
jgi:transposase